ncbi:hypothetical protein DLAC_03892 [Tieghemostelium lacteum]|uniref:Transmembrane protein n=1 Tax=Tieghemostelium lacteum TaxID=361077 RepID=A0A152A125_TIELA|nr:hypothetical protein DLAC_03892 [Tieghemostelium lacteum]|eukprot:KYQ99925.1 hypothetical protein DLAC_03892 [Tieghemostelium lacteum]
MQQEQILRERPNLIVSPKFPNVIVNWENRNVRPYMEFLKYYMDIKSRQYRMKTIASMILSTLLVICSYIFIDFENESLLQQTLNVFILAVMIISLFYSSLRAYCSFFKQVPCVRMTDDERRAYGWPLSFPTSPNSPVTIDIDDYYKRHGGPDNTPSKQQQISKSPTSDTKPTYNSLLEQITTTPSQSLDNSIYMSPQMRTGEKQQQQQNIDDSYDEDHENNKVSSRIKERLFSNISEFLPKLNFGSSENNSPQKQSPMKSNLDSQVVLPLDVLSSVFQIKLPSNAPDKLNPKTTYEQVIESKQSAFDNYLYQQHFQHKIQTCYFQCARWFTVNVLKPIQQHAENYIDYLDEQALQQEQGHQISIDTDNITAVPYQRIQPGMSSIDTMKCILKKMHYNLDRLNEVHHRRENHFICKRLIDLAQDHVRVFGKTDEHGNPDDEQILFSLFCAYMDDKLNRDVTAPIPDLPFSTKFINISQNRSNKMMEFAPLMINVSFSKPLQCDILLKGEVIDISPGNNNFYFTVILYFFYIIKDSDGYLENLNVDQLSVRSFLYSILSTNDDQSDSDDSSDYSFEDYSRGSQFN